MNRTDKKFLRQFPVIGVQRATSNGLMNDDAWLCWEHGGHFFAIVTLDFDSSADNGFILIEIASGCQVGPCGLSSAEEVLARGKVIVLASEERGQLAQVYAAGMKLRANADKPRRTMQEAHDEGV